MAFLLAGTVIGSLVIYNNSEYLVINGLKAYTVVQEYLNTFNFYENNDDNTISNNLLIKQYPYKNKIFYRIKTDNKDDPDEKILEKFSLLMNPILNINLCVNNKKNYEVTKISDFLFLEKEIELSPKTNKLWIDICNILLNHNICYDDEDTITWEIMDNNLNVVNGDNITLKYEENLEMIKN